MHPSAPQPQPPHGRPPQAQPPYGRPPYAQPAGPAYSGPAHAQPGPGHPPHAQPPHAQPSHAQHGPAQPAPARPASAGGRPGRRHVVRMAIAGILALATAALWATGGLRDQPTGPVKIAPGRAIDQGRFSVTVQSAQIRQEKDSFSDEQKRFLVVRMHIVNQAKETASLGVHFMSGFTGVPQPGNYLDPDEINGLAAGGKTGGVHPGLPIDAEAIWELPQSSTPRQVTVALRQWDFSAGFTIREKHWSAGKGAPIIATVTLPVVAS